MFSTTRFKASGIIKASNGHQQNDNSPIFGTAATVPKTAKPTRRPATPGLGRTAHTPQRLRSKAKVAIRSAGHKAKAMVSKGQGIRLSSEPATHAMHQSVISYSSRPTTANSKLTTLSSVTPTITRTSPSGRNSQVVHPANHIPSTPPPRNNVRFSHPAVTNARMLSPQSIRSNGRQLPPSPQLDSIDSSAIPAAVRASVTDWNRLSGVERVKAINKVDGLGSLVPRKFLCALDEVAEDLDDEIQEDRADALSTLEGQHEINREAALSALEGKPNIQLDLPVFPADSETEFNRVDALSVLNGEHELNCEAALLALEGTPFNPKTTALSNDDTTSYELGYIPYSGEFSPDFDNGVPVFPVKHRKGGAYESQTYHPVKQGVASGTSRVNRVSRPNFANVVSGTDREYKEGGSLPQTRYSPPTGNRQHSMITPLPQTHYIPPTLTTQTHPTQGTQRAGLPTQPRPPQTPQALKRKAVGSSNQIPAPLGSHPMPMYPDDFKPRPIKVAKRPVDVNKPLPPSPGPRSPRRFTYGAVPGGGRCMFSV